MGLCAPGFSEGRDRTWLPGIQAGCGGYAIAAAHPGDLEARRGRFRIGLDLCVPAERAHGHGGSGFFDERQAVMGYSLANQLPTAADWRCLPQDEIQPMIMLGASAKAVIHQGNSYVMRIVEKGERAGDLPIQQPSKFDMAISRKTAAAKVSICRRRYCCRPTN
jgi:hypothetical protein